MNQIILKQALGFAAMGILLMAGQAKAAIETFSVNYGTAASPLTQPFYTTLSLNEFDSSLGVLNKVTLKLNSYDVVSAQILNVTPSSQRYNSASATLPVTVTALAGLTTTAIGTASYGAGSVGPGFGTTTLAGATQNPQASTSLNSGFSAYIGTGGQTFLLTLTGNNGTYGGSSVNPGALYFGGVGSSYGTVTIDYEYSPLSFVPEPTATTKVAGLSALGVLLVTLRKKFVPMS